MSLTYETVFTPIFIIVSLSIIIGGIVFLQFLDKIFHGSNNINAIRIFGVAIIINLVIFIFLIMSFRRIKFAEGPSGPQGNRGNNGIVGKDGGLSVCGPQYQTVQDKKNFERQLNYLDLKPPVISE